ncbi:MAG: PEGA domain-containing protein, partial [Candidatus Uhrbacteria bacterium]|nr:PEGA domain-containing protein [Candidatus Uhrbacteria bacterium]
TAVLNIASEPRNASVFVDETSYSDRTPAVLETILPGQHTVRLEKEGYLPWETVLNFESREARVMGPIVLFLDVVPTLQRTIEATITAIHKETSRFAYATQESSWLEVWIVDMASSETKLLMRFPYTATSTYSISWSENGTYLALIETHGSRQDISVTRVSDGYSIALPKEARDVEEAWWDLGVESRLYVRAGEELTQIDVGNLAQEILPFTAKRLSSFGNKTVTLSESSDRAALSYQEGKTASIITYLPLGDYEFISAPQDLIGLSDTRHHRLILLDPQNREQPILMNEEVTHWKWSPSQDVLLYSSGYDVKQYVRSAHETSTITRLSTPIDGIDWLPKGSSAIYQTNGKTVAINLDGTTILSQTFLATNLDGTFWLSPDGSFLYVLQETQTGWEWWTRNLQN